MPPDSLATSPPTLREIARAAGVSHTTVSLSLRNHPSIPQATRDRIRALADDLGYRSNALVAALMTQVRARHHKCALEVVAFLHGGPSASDWRNHSASVGYFEGATALASKLGMRVEPFWLGEGGAAAAATCRMLRARAIRGALLAPFPKPDYRHELDWSGLICVGLGYVFKELPLHRATHNHFHAAMLACRSLARLGYRRIGLMLSHEENKRVNHAWLGGYLAARNEAHARLEPLLTEPSFCPSAVSSWFDSNAPDAVIGFGPQQFFSLREAGYRVSQDVAYAALDVEQMHLAGVQDAAGIDQNLPLAGATAIDKLATLLYHNQQGLAEFPALSMIEGRWIEGATAPDRALAPAPALAGA